jgi:hypothetical protein
LVVLEVFGLDQPRERLAIDTTRPLVVERFIKDVDDRLDEELPDGKHLRSQLNK